jgi:uncharacterized protein (DUF433 family)
VASGKEWRLKQQLVREMVGGEWYEYIPLGKFVVSAPAVCRGRPTFKYTPIEAASALERLAAGHDIEALMTDSRGRLSKEMCWQVRREREANEPCFAHFTPTLPTVL